MSQPWLLLIVAVGLWYMFMFRFNKIRKQTDSRLLYWTGGFMHDHTRSMVFKAALMIVNVGLLYLVILLIYMAQGRL